MKTLTSYLQTHAEDRPLVGRALEMTAQTLALARNGCYEHLRSAIFDGRVIGRNIKRAVGREVVRIEHFTVPAPFTEKAAALKYGERIRYQDSFAYHLREYRWSALNGKGNALYGTGGWPGIKNDLWKRLRRDVAEPFRFNFWDINEAELAPRNTPGENLLTTLFYTYAAAFADDDAGLDDLGGVARTLDLYIPIGEESKLPGQWLLVRTPAAIMEH